MIRRNRKSNWIAKWLWHAPLIERALTHWNKTERHRNKRENENHSNRALFMFVRTCKIPIFNKIIPNTHSTFKLCQSIFVTVSLIIAIAINCSNICANITTGTATTITIAAAATTHICTTANSIRATIWAVLDFFRWASLTMMMTIRMMSITATAIVMLNYAWCSGASFNGCWLATIAATATLIQSFTWIETKAILVIRLCRHVRIVDIPNARVRVSIVRLFDVWWNLVVALFAIVWSMLQDVHTFNSLSDFCFFFNFFFFSSVDKRNQAECFLLSKLFLLRSFEFTFFCLFIYNFHNTINENIRKQKKYLFLFLLTKQKLQLFNGTCVQINNNCSNVIAVEWMKEN